MLGQVLDYESPRDAARDKNMFKPDVGKNNESAREAWLEKTLAAVPAKSRILDAGAGTQRYRRVCANFE